jgi:signal transduction histidine kinase
MARTPEPMRPDFTPSSPVASLADWLADRRRALLSRWRASVRADRSLTTSDTLSRAQFEDHVPAILDGFVERLRALADPPADPLAPASLDASASRGADARRSAVEHGVHRWQQGYDQRETIREWRHLQLCLLDEVDAFCATGPFDAGALVAARRLVAAMCLDGMEASAAQFMDMHRTEAASRLQELQTALAQLADIERQRVAILREAAHDLRGNVGTLRTVSHVLGRTDLPEAVRNDAAGALRRGVASLHALLTDLLDLSRLEAGLEQRQAEPFDAAQVLRALCDALQHVATERGLFLRYDGVDAMQVEGDRIKVVRIAQNLVLNALRCTERGGVLVGCQPGAAETPRWMLIVRDTGPGMPDHAASPLAIAIKDATTEARETVAEADADADADAGTARPGASDLLPALSAVSDASPGEGLGLTIVKRLCELLDASIELDSGPGQGTTFRITLPARY